MVLIFSLIKTEYMKLLFFFLLLSSSLLGQGTGEMSGTVVDEDGFTMPFVRILVACEQNGVQTIVTGADTDVDGEFHFLCLEVGSYNLIVRNYSGEDLTIEKIQVMENTISRLGDIKLTYPEIIGCDFGLPYPTIQNTMDPFGSYITLKSEDLRMR